MNSVEDVLEVNEDLYIIGGQSIYEQFMPYADRLIVTHVSGTYDCDTFFPQIEPTQWEKDWAFISTTSSIVITHYNRKNI